MDFTETPDQAAFRTAARTWIVGAFAERPIDEPRSQAERQDLAVWWQQRLHQDNWAGISWPVEYGGRGLTSVEEAVFNEEAARLGAPLPVNVIGMMLAGPTIMHHGTEEQKTNYLPKILSGEQIWCQGFSEPGSGSDLASLRTKAEKVDGGWNVDGQKVWTSWGHLAQKCLLLTRTDSSESKHKGITYLLADMADIEVRPLTMVNGDAEFNEMFLSGVFVDDSDLLGTVGEGWRYALTTLSFERAGIALNLHVWAQQAFDDLVELVISSGRQHDAAVVEQVGRFRLAVDALRVGSQRAMATVGAGSPPGAETSVLKILWAHAMQDICRFALDLLGIEGMLGDDSIAEPWTHRYLRTRGHTIEGGTDEVQKSIIAERVLGMPRSR